MSKVDHVVLGRSRSPLWTAVFLVDLGPLEDISVSGGTKCPLCTVESLVDSNVPYGYWCLWYIHVSLGTQCFCWILMSLVDLGEILTWQTWRPYRPWRI